MKRDLTELNKLEEYLKEHGFEYFRQDWVNPIYRKICARNLWAHMTTLGDLLDRHQIIVMEGGRVIWDVVCQFGSYGGDEGLLEGMGEIFGDDVQGWLTADEVIARIEKHAQEPET